MDLIGQQQKAPAPPPPASASSTAASAAAPDALSLASLPYCGDLDAARRARDSHAVRLLTQLRDQSSLSPQSSPSSRSSSMLPCPPAASQAPAPSSSASITQRLHDMELGPGGKGRRESSSSSSTQPAAEGGWPLPPSPITRRQAAPASACPPGFFSAEAGLSSPTATARAKMVVSSSISLSMATGAGSLASSPGVATPGAAAGSAAVGFRQQRRHFFAYEGPAAAAAAAASATGEELDDDADRPLGGGGSIESKCAASSCCPPSAARGHHSHHHEQQQQYMAAAKDGSGARRGLQTVVAGGGSSFYAVPVLTTQPPTAAGEAPDAAGEALAVLEETEAQVAAKAQEEEEEEEEEATIEDPVLLARVRVSQSYRVECACGHRFGLETLYGCVKAALLSDDLIPACPLANHPDRAQRCDYLLSQKEVEHVLNRYLPSVSKLPAEDRRLWRFRRGRLIDGRLGWVSERVSEAFLRKGKIGSGCIECPNGRCGYWVEPTRPREKQRVDCPKCLTAFCTLCKRPYHYRCSCDEVMTITKQWLEWQQHGREPYLQKMAAEDSSYQAALDTFNDRRSAHGQEVHTAEQNWELLVADENYKSSRCRRCPHCNRVIERIDGCDTMICGQNAHGGNIQNGCGQAFNWNEALFYHADIGEKRSIKPFEEVPPPEIARVTHQIMDDGTPIRCDICDARIQGPLAMCINCPTFNCCIRCQNKHTRGHVLRLYMDNSYRQQRPLAHPQQQRQQKPGQGQAASTTA